jgi:hypothetical protein
MRYGTIPIVRSVGGLKDTVPDIGMPDGSGRGIRFDHFSVEDAYNAIYRAVSMFQNEPGIVQWLQNKIMAVDFSWEHAVAQYLQIYRNIGAQVGPAQPQSEPLAIITEDLSSQDTKADLTKKGKTSKTAAKPKSLDAKKEDKAPKPPKTTKPK